MLSAASVTTADVQATLGVPASGSDSPHRVRPWSRTGGNEDTSGSSSSSRGEARAVVPVGFRAHRRPRSLSTDGAPSTSHSSSSMLGSSQHSGSKADPTSQSSTGGFDVRSVMALGQSTLDPQFGDSTLLGPASSTWTTYSAMPTSHVPASLAVPLDQPIPATHAGSRRMKTLHVDVTEQHGAMEPCPLLPLPAGLMPAGQQPAKPGPSWLDLLYSSYGHEGHASM